MCDNMDVWRENQLCNCMRVGTWQPSTRKFVLLLVIDVNERKVFSPNVLTPLFHLYFRLSSNANGHPAHYPLTLWNQSLIQMASLMCCCIWL